MKKVAIISSTDYKSYPMGGMMSFILDIVPYLRDQFEITLWGVSPNVDSTLNSNCESIQFPVKIFSTVKIGKKYIPNIIRVTVNLFFKMKDILSCNYDIIYFHGIPLSLPFLLKKKKKPKIVNHIHGVTNPFGVSLNKFISSKLMASLYEKYRRWVIKNSDLILLAADKKTYIQFSSQFPAEIQKKIIRIPNFADRNTFFKMDRNKVRIQLGLPKDINILINTGRLSKQKDPILLIESFYHYHSVFDNNSKLIIIGEGDLKNLIENKIKELNLSSHVMILGPLSRNEIALWLNAADVFVYTSYGNGIPISLIEAAMCGLPIVSTSITGVYDLVVHDYTGYLVEKRDPEDIARKIKLALSKKDILSNNITEISTNLTPNEISSIISKYFIILLEKQI
jgi:glycosyltransferase involved in cell wall biosynthesis